MRDRLGREIEYLRVSVTQNCNLKCIYCNPGDTKDDSGDIKVPGNDTCSKGCSSALTPSEFEAIVKPMADLGVKYVRITGGEPLIRPDICEIIERIAHIKGIEDISMTTNGINLDRMVEQLKKAGLKRLNISLDSLQKDKFKYITGGGNLESTLNGIEKAISIGLMPIKTNTVLIKGVNDDEIEDFIALAKDKPIEVRFIELMPIGKFGEENADKIINSSEIIDSHPEFVLCEDNNPSKPAQCYRIEGYKGKIGFISAMSHKFCDKCNRVRLTCDGKIKLCLGNNAEVDVIEVLRNNPENLDEFIEKVIYEKPEGHNFGKGSFSSVRNMSRIGG